MTRCLAAANAPRNRSRLVIPACSTSLIATDQIRQLHYSSERNQLFCCLLSVGSTASMHLHTPVSERKAEIGFPAKQMFCVSVLVIITEIIYEKSYCSDRRGSR